MAAQRLGEDSVTVAFLGDGATSAGDVHEALNLASVFSAPCIFYVQNNQWAISLPVSRQLAAPSIAHRADAYGMPGIRVDGNDVLACYAVMAAAAERARDRRRPDVDRGGHLPDGSTHHLRRPDTVPIRGRTRIVARPRPGVALPHLPAEHRGVDGAARAAGRRTRDPDREPSCATPSSARPTPTYSRCSTPSTPTSPRTWRPSENSCGPSWRRRRDMTQIFERPPMLGRHPVPTGPMLPSTQSPWCRRSTGRYTTRWPPTTVCWSSARTSRPLGGVFRVTEGLAETFGEATLFRHPAGRVRHRRHRHRDGDPWLSCRCPKSSSTASPIRRSTRWSATWPSTGCAPTAISTCR